LKFSIITPSYNQLDWLALNIRSVADQIQPEAGTKSAKVEKYEGKSLRKSEDSQPTNLCTSKLTGVPIPQGIGITPSHTDGPAISIEHLVMDGGTPELKKFADKMSAELLAKYGGELFKDRPTFELLHLCTSSGYTLRIFQEPDEGMYDAINKGLKLAAGEICAWLNCDEQYLPDTLNTIQREILSMPKKSIFFGDVVVIDKKGGYLCTRRAVTPTIAHTLVSGNLSFYSAACFFRKEKFLDRNLFLDSQWKIIGDAEWTSRWVREGIKGQVVKRPLSAFIWTGENLSYNKRADQEKDDFKKTAPPIYRFFTHLIIFLSRLRKWLSGAYSLESITYSIFTDESPNERKPFSVNEPTHRWPGKSA